MGDIETIMKGFLGSCTEAGTVHLRLSFSVLLVLSFSTLAL